MADKAANTEKPAGPAGSPPATTKEVAQRRLLAVLLTADKLNGRLNKVMSTPAGQERVFAFVQYTSHILHHVLTSAPSVALQARLGLLARLQSTGKSSSQSESQGSTPPLLALSSLASQARFMLRLLGLPSLLAWGSSTIKSPPADKTIYILNLLQVLSNITYQFLENAAFLATKGVIPKRFLDKYGGDAKWSLWSIRAWLGHILLQYLVLWRARVLRKKDEAEAKAQGLTEAKQAALRAETRAWNKSLVNNVCWTPLCLHWCFEQGLGFPGHLTGLVSFMAGGWGFADLWAATL
ncbi:hypothetical protein BDV18DRAFT_135493 [Aspergillus unguis]